VDAMPRFALKTLLLSTSLVAIGLAAAVSAPAVRIHSQLACIVVHGLWFGGGAIAGAGIGLLLPFKMPSLGIMLGAILGAFVLLFVLIPISAGN
jgi:hypothetical protein